jgi:SAM-dependent methyltransferase
MGICYHDARLMWNARQSGAPFERVLTIGRQSLCLHPDEVEFFVTSYARKFPDARPLPRQDFRFGADAAIFLRECLGAANVEALDYSDYDRAEHLHDLNYPVPAALRGQFDAVFDGGALEHVFNFPAAVANLMQMTRVGGRIFMSTPANNFLGHGFYQFSPELMFRVFAPENGFEIQRVELVEARYPSPELTPNRVAYAVADPANVRCRVGLVTKRPVIMMVEAKKTANVPLFVRAPLQSDYVSAWAAAGGRATIAPVAAPSWIRHWRSRVLALTPSRVRTMLVGAAQLRRYSLSNLRFYRRVS